MIIDRYARGMSQDAKDIANSGFHSISLWDDIIIMPESLGSGASSPDLTTFSGTILAYAFDGNVTSEQLYGGFEIPHTYKEGTTLRPHIHWSPSNANAGNVKWKLDYVICDKNTGGFTSPATISAIQETGSQSLKNNVVEFDIISGTDIRIGCIVKFRLYRDPTDVNDTYASDAFLLSLGIHHEVNSDGSRQVFIK
jgi:hypothetical protein